MSGSHHLIQIGSFEAFQPHKRPLGPSANRWSCCGHKPPPLHHRMRARDQCLYRSGCNGRGGHRVKKFARRMRKRTQTTQLCASCTVPPPVASPFILQDCWVPVLRTEVSSTSSHDRGYERAQAAFGPSQTRLDRGRSPGQPWFTRCAIQHDNLSNNPSALAEEESSWLVKQGRRRPRVRSR
jgi:hypothetical protein